jgi:hypothetical protein
MTRTAIVPRHLSFLPVNGQAAEIRQVDQHVERVSQGLAMKREGEQVVALALREKLDAVGEGPWLAWCQEHWGWKRAAAYTHLNPEQLAKNRSRQRPQAVDIPPGSLATVERVQQPEDPRRVPKIGVSRDVWKALELVDSSLSLSGLTPEGMRLLLSPVAAEQVALVQRTASWLQALYGLLKDD